MLEQPEFQHFVELDIPKVFMLLEIIFPAWFVFDTGV